MDHVFWLVPGVLAGRCGPNERPWQLTRLRQSGIGAVLSVNDGELCDPVDFERHGLVYGCIPLSDNAPPCVGDLEHCLQALPKALAFATANISRRRPVLVHCAAGKDRTGLFLAYYLMQCENAPLERAMEQVRAVRPVAFTAEGWHDFAVQVLSATSARGRRRDSSLRLR